MQPQLLSAVHLQSLPQLQTAVSANDREHSAKITITTRIKHFIFLFLSINPTLTNQHLLFKPRNFMTGTNHHWNVPEFIRKLTKQVWVQVAIRRIDSMPRWIKLQSVTARLSILIGIDCDQARQTSIRNATS
jgi:hypothetical protein